MHSGELIFTRAPMIVTVPSATSEIVGACIAIAPDVMASVAEPTCTFTAAGVTTTLVVPTMIDTIVGVATCTPAGFMAIV